MNILNSQSHPHLPRPVFSGTYTQVSMFKITDLLTWNNYAPHPLQRKGCVGRGWWKHWILQQQMDFVILRGKAGDGIRQKQTEKERKENLTHNLPCLFHSSMMTFHQPWHSSCSLLCYTLHPNVWSAEHFSATLKTSTKKLSAGRAVTFPGNLLETPWGQGCDSPFEKHCLSS